MDKYIITRAEIAAFEGIDKTHFLNPNAKRVNKSLGDLTGLTGLGFHIVEIEPGCESTELHAHYFEDECVYILDGCAEAQIGDEVFAVGAGDFIGYRAGGAAHKLTNVGESVLRCIVVGQRLDHDVADYPDKAKRIFRNRGMAWNLVDLDALEKPVAGKKI
jgi:uncharacterized cupin superfamily protein